MGCLDSRPGCNQPSAGQLYYFFANCEVESWYNGYLLKDTQVYNPRAIVGAMLHGDFKNYWAETSSNDAIVPLISMNYDGLQFAIIEIISGAEVNVDTAVFTNDPSSIASKDDVLTYMIHLGYSCVPSPCECGTDCE